MNSLDGIRILDLSRVLAGPWCTQTLADLGADVIKIERPGAGDDTRSWGPPFLKDAAGNDTPEAAYYLGTNRNKRSLTCDISKPDGQALIRELVTRCDVFIENFKVGDMARYGLDYPSLKAINPRLVYCSVTGFGQTGPYSDRAGYDYAVQGIGGLMSVTGERDDLGGGPQKVGVAVADLFTGMYASVGIYLVSGKTPGRAGNAHQNIVPYQVFEVKPALNAEPDARDHLILAVGNDGQFAKFCDVAGHPELASDPRFSKNTERVKNRQVLVPMLENIMLKRTKAQWLPALESAKVPCGAINNLSEVFEDPQVAARNMIDTWQHPHQKDLRLVASPLKLSLTPVRQDHAPPQLGQHTAQLLSEVLGYSNAQIEQLQSKGVI